MFKKLRPGRFCGPAKGKTNPGPPPRLELPRRKAAGAQKPAHLKPVGQAGASPRAEKPSPARPAVPVPLAQPPSARGAAVQSFGRLMLVGPRVRLKGEIQACERLVIEGAVEGEVSATEHLEVARGGRFQGKARIESCAINGVFEGDLEVRGVLSLKANGRVSGKVRYGGIEIERGGIIEGDFAAQGAAGVPDRIAGPRPA